MWKRVHQTITLIVSVRNFKDALPHHHRRSLEYYEYILMKKGILHKLRFANENKPSFNANPTTTQISFFF